jgi:hypothetical protein
MHLTHVQDEAITLEYAASAFTLSGCANTFTIVSDKDCIFSVNNKPGTYPIGITNGQKRQIKVLSKPKMILVTDKKRLVERYGDEDEVITLLEQAYRTASDQDGIVYDLGNYMDDSLWQTTGGYDGGIYAVK